MVIWSWELREYGTEFQPRAKIKGRAIVDFIAEFTYDVNLEEGDEEEGRQVMWGMYGTSMWMALQTLKALGLDSSSPTPMERN